MDSGDTTRTSGSDGLNTLDVIRIRRDFPILGTMCRGKSLVYLDNAATTQKPRQVVDAITRFYYSQNANVRRSVHYLGEQATEAHENARETLRRFLGAPRACEIIFTRGATEGINLVAQTFGRQRIDPGDEVIVSEMEHHSNLVPWQRLCKEREATLHVLPLTDNGALELDALAGLLNERTRLLAVTHVSNVLGTVNPVARIVEIAHDAGVPVLVDGAQSAPHFPVDVEALGCDFFVCSGHKMFGPTGIGVLYGREALLDAMPPHESGGEMVLTVTLEGATYDALPHKFEAGTPNIAGALGLAAAVKYLETVGMDRIARYERELLASAVSALRNMAGVTVFGAADERAGSVSFAVEGVHAHDVAQVLDGEGIAVRGGDQCAQPLMRRLGVSAMARASFAFYNTSEEVYSLERGIRKVREVFG